MLPGKGGTYQRLSWEGVTPIDSLVKSLTTAFKSFTIDRVDFRLTAHTWIAHCYLTVDYNIS